MILSHIGNAFLRPSSENCGTRTFLLALAIQCLFGLSLASAQFATMATPLTIPAMPAISPLGTSLPPSGLVTLSDATSGARIYYTLNGSLNYFRYTAPFSIAGSSTVQAVAVNVGGGTYTESPIATQTYTAGGGTSPAWSRLSTLPALFSSQSGTLINAGDANLYGVSFGGRSPQVVVSVSVALQSNLTQWTNITSPALSQNGTEYESALGTTPNGTVLMAETNFSTLADVYFWNGSTSSPIWQKITGWTGYSSSSIYNFTNDSAGYTYFSPAWSGDIWRNDAPNSTHFTKVFTNLYSLTGSGTYGGLYQTFIWNLGDGKGDTMWTCGEGVLMNVDLGFTKATQYLNSSGYKGNCFGLGKSAKNILALRTANTAGDTLSQISISTRNTAVVPSSGPISPLHYPSYIDTNLINSLQWVNGTNWVLNNIANSTTYLLMSPDDGNTWTDITASGGIDSSCTGSNLSVGSTVTSHYVFARCQNGHVYWQYGPF